MDETGPPEARTSAVGVRDRIPRVRPEAPDDLEAVHALLARAFPSEGEARLVDALRGRTEPQVSLVAEDGAARVVGHILFTPVGIGGRPTGATAMGLGPMAVLPPRQRRGIGSALVEAGLAACRAAGTDLVVVLGHPAYYPRFGFREAWSHGLYYASPGVNPAFMVRELAPGALRGHRGEVRYHSCFDLL